MNETLFGEKKRLRQTVLTNREALSAQEVTARSAQILERLRQLPALTQARVIMGYAPFRNEVDLMPWLKERKAAGVMVLLPRVVAESGELEAVPFLDEDDMTTSGFGVREPEGPACDISTIEAVLVPGVVFDRQGYRIGYGKGFYDRFLPRLQPGTFVCAVAFDLQVVERVPHDENDQRVDNLVTESGVWQF